MSGSTSRRVRKGANMMVDALLETVEPGTEIGEVLSDILINIFDVATDKIDGNVGDLMTGVGGVVYQLAANLNAEHRAALIDYLENCVNEASVYDGKGDEEGLQFSFYPTPESE